jgi:acyl carrier protein
MLSVEQEIRTFVIENFVYAEGADRFSDDDSFLQNGLVDSMGIMTLVDFVSKTYAIRVEDEELVPDNWDSVNRIAAFVRSRLKEKVSPAERNGNAAAVFNQHP